VSVGGNVSLLLAGDGDDPAPSTKAAQPATEEQQDTVADDPATATAGTSTVPPEPARTEPEEPAPAPATPPSGGAEAPGDVDVPERPSEAVTCRTASATLTIVDEARPLLLGDTHVRIQAATATQRGLTVRVRVRNETDAEQGIQAGGQELYLNLNGIRVDPEPIRDERLPPQTGRTISMRFLLTPARMAVLSRLGGRAELGVRPWTAGGPTAYVGVIRFSAQGG
jgi:hypothetical protein